MDLDAGLEFDGGAKDSGDESIGAYFFGHPVIIYPMRINIIKVYNVP
jgi:hypothetical protein